MKLLSLNIILLLSLMSCQTHKEESRIFFGGEIINPKTDFVLLMQHEKVLDTLPIGKGNTFGKYISGLTSGLYSFKHGYEFQYLFLVPSDSIRIRLNTWDFDNTLVFDGKGAERNELLLDIFKGNEAENRGFYTTALLDENSFTSKMDTCLSHHNSLFKEFLMDNTNEPASYQHLIDGAINYPIYRLKELYPYWHKKISKDTSFTTSLAYYKFRDQINLNDTLLSQYYAYRNFVSTHLYKLANKANHNKGFDEHFRTLLLESIISTIKIPSLKNQLLYNEVYPSLFDDSCQLSPEHLNLFYENSSDTILINRVKLLLKEKNELIENSLFPDFNIMNRQGKEQPILNVLKDHNAVIYFWSREQFSTDYIEKRIQYLTTKFPKTLFIGLNTDQSQDKYIALLKHNSNQFFLHKNSKGFDLIKSKYPRTILVNSKGRIHTSYTLLTNSKIESKIHDLLLN